MGWLARATQRRQTRTISFSEQWNYLLAALAAATILSKRLSPRKESQHGFKSRSPYVRPFGIVATSFKLLERGVALTRPRVNQRQVGQRGPDR